MPSDGFGVPYKFALVWSSLFYTLLGLYFLRKLLRVWFTSELLVSVVLIIILFGTNLFHYVVWQGTMSHSYSFALITLFLWLTYCWHRQPRWRYSILLGLLTGWIFLVRPVNLWVLVIFAGWGVSNFPGLKKQVTFFLHHWKQLAVIGFFAFLAALPQLIYWKYATGHWLFYSYVGERFYFSHPMILEGLFSWRKGWLLYTPVMLLAFLALPFFGKKIRELTIVYPVTLVAVIYISFSWWCWWYGGAFSQRALTDWYGLFALPIAALLDTVRKRKAAWIACGIFLLLVMAWNQFQNAQYRNGSIHYDAMTRKAYFYDTFRLQKRPYVYRLYKSPDYATAHEGRREYFWE
jgi:hypothetical protein